MIKQILALGALVAATQATAVTIPITGVVTPKCVIGTVNTGVFGNPTADVLSTALVDGGIPPVVRFDIVQPNFYKAVITVPDSFSSAPSLDDVVNWTGTVTVSRVTDPAMSSYTTNRRMYNSTTEFDLTVTGSTWFTITSKAQFGYQKSFPVGQYKAVVQAECIAL